MRAQRFEDQKINCLWGSDQLGSIFVTRVKFCFTFKKSSKAMRPRRDMGHWMTVTVLRNERSLGQQERAWGATFWEANNGEQCVGRWLSRGRKERQSWVQSAGTERVNPCWQSAEQRQKWAGTVAGDGPLQGSRGGLGQLGQGERRSENCSGNGWGRKMSNEPFSCL